MSFRSLSIQHAVWALVAACALAGCRTAPEAAPFAARAAFQEDFADAEALITPESVQQAEMVLQRAQAELRLGGSFPFEPLDPRDDTRADPGLALGAKLSFEVMKNLFLGVAFDWSRHEVDQIDNVNEQIRLVEEYDRFNFLGQIDYDFPLTADTEHPLFLRLGFGSGVVVIDPVPRQPPLRDDLENIYQIVFRPSVGLRYQVHPNVLFFAEGSFDFVPERSFITSEDERVTGERPTLDTGIIWLGVAFQWQ